MSASEFLPWAEGAINIATTAVLFLGKQAVVAGQTERHKVCMRLAVGLGLIFLAVFFLRQGFVAPRTIRDPLALRYFYIALLVVHLPAATILPFVVVPTVWFAIRGNLERHRPLARILYPLWIVSNITGIVSLVLVFTWGSVAT